MKIILEGPDGVGKSTLLSALQRRDPKLTCTALGSTGAIQDEMRVLLTSDVLDRSYLSEQVYGPTLRKFDALGSHRRRMLDRVALGQGYVVVVLRPPLQVALGRYRSVRAESPNIPDEQTWLALRDAYDKLRTFVPLVYYRSQTTNLRALRALVKSCAPPVNRGPGIGWFERGVTLLVGESCPREEQYQQPFVWHDGCAPWLANCLDDWGVDERDLYWTNADQVEAHGRDWIKLLMPRRIVVMGKRAHEMRLDKLVPAGHYHAVPHPQHWKRFHHGANYELREILTSEAR